ncbi:MAG: PhnD/SsuA/transferrin family substrate-binding protein [Caldimonas sp.]
MKLIANARMYSTTVATKAAWTRLFEWAHGRSGVPLAMLAHEPPKLLATLWERNDLGAVMMCGLPLSRRAAPPLIVAQPVPSLPRYGGRAVYCTDIVVAANAPYRTLADTFGARVGYTLKDSQSGYYALRHHLLTHHADVAEPYAAITGGLMNARGVIAAIAAGRIDVGPLDGYVHDLIIHTEPEFAAQVRILVSTEQTPMPAIVASDEALTPDALARLRDAFSAAITAPELAAERATLLLAGFAQPGASAFEALKARADIVDAGPPWP